MGLTTIRTGAQKAFMAGIQAADPEKVLQKALDSHPLCTLKSGRYIIVSVGKAACKMARTAIRNVPDGTAVTAVAVTNYENVTDIENCTVFGAAHPVPDSNGLHAASEVITLLESATKDDVVLALISGGSSALLPAPIDGISLFDKSRVNEVLLSEGFDIYEMNLVRQSLSKLKGGGFLRYAAPAEVRSYILSDVLGDDLRVVGSGPSIGAIGTIADARRLLIERGVFTKMPKFVRAYLEGQPYKMEIPEPGQGVLIGGNSQSLSAMAADINAQISFDPLIGDVEAAAQRIIDEVKKMPNNQPFAIAFGGEITVNITGDGKGGRNQELALRVANKAHHAKLPNNWCFLSGGTDGRDGPTDAAGGLVDQGTVSRIQKTGGDVDKLLKNNDSYQALKLAGDLLTTGATGTNVADLQLFIYEPA